MMAKKKNKKLKGLENYKTKEQVLLSWSRPPKGWYKLNVDGTVHKRIGGGGVIRDHYGLCFFVVWSFYGTVHVFSINESESGFQSLAPLILLRDQRNGFVVNDTCIIEAEVAVRKAEVKILEDPCSSICEYMEAMFIGENQDEE